MGSSCNNHNGNINEHGGDRDPKAWPLVVEAVAEASLTLSGTRIIPSSSFFCSTVTLPDLSGFQNLRTAYIDHWTKNVWS